MTKAETFAQKKIKIENNKYCILNVFSWTIFFFHKFKWVQWMRELKILSKISSTEKKKKINIQYSETPARKVIEHVARACPRRNRFRLVRSGYLPLSFSCWHQLVLNNFVFYRTGLMLIENYQRLSYPSNLICIFQTVDCPVLTITTLFVRLDSLICRFHTRDGLSV